MFKKLEIVKDSNKILREKSKEVNFPLSSSDKDTINKIIKHLTYSQIPDLSEKYDIRPGMGLAFVQLGMLKRIVVVVHEYEEGKFKEYVLINPKVISQSKEMIAAGLGEGCLSVDKEIEGHVLRHARITIEGFDVNGEKKKIRAREELAIAFQHELDHLDGIMFYDRIDPKKRFYEEGEIRFL